MNLAELLTNPEQVNSMFGGDLNLTEARIESILLFSGPSLRIGFNQPNLPVVAPLKWKVKKFNAFSFSLEFVNIQEVLINYWEPQMECITNITSNDGEIFLNMSKGGKCIASCRSEFLTLRDVRGYYEARID